MYQKHLTKSIPDTDENQFADMLKIFQSSMMLGDVPTESDDSEWDMTIEYTPNHACIWNKIKMIGLPVIILEKNDKFAFVQPTNIERTKGVIDEINLPMLIYRLEDLVKY